MKKNKQRKRTKGYKEKRKMRGTKSRCRVKKKGTEIMSTNAFGVSTGSDTDY